MLNNCTKCSVYTLNKDFICDAQVEEITNSDASIIFLDDFADVLTTEVLVTFYDDIQGLVSYYCTLSEYKEVILINFRNHFSSHCHLDKLAEIIQRRNDIKVKTNLPVTLTFKDEDEQEQLVEAVIKNISAGGLFIISKESLSDNQEFSFVFPKSETPFTLHAKVLRSQEVPQEHHTGYGCKFILISIAKESLIREYVFREQVKHKRKHK